MTTDVFATATAQLDAPWSDPGETMGQVARVAKVNAASPAAGWSDDPVEKLKKLVARLYKRLEDIARRIKNTAKDAVVSFTITVGVTIGVSLTVTA